MTARAMLPSSSAITIQLGGGVSMITFVNTVPISENRAVNRCVRWCCPPATCFCKLALHKPVALPLFGLLLPAHCWCVHASVHACVLAHTWSWCDISLTFASTRFALIRNFAGWEGFDGYARNAMFKILGEDKVWHSPNECDGCSI